MASNLVTTWSQQEIQYLLGFYNDKKVQLRKGNFGKAHWYECTKHVNENKNENNPLLKTSPQCKGKWNSLR